MDIIIKDNETDIILYGHSVLETIVRSGKEQKVKLIKIPAEAWIAFLQVRYSHVPAVAAYLAASDDGINPQEGKLLKAVDEAIEPSNEELDDLLEIIAASDLRHDEGEE
jgi:hypothetical protein